MAIQPKNTGDISVDSINEKTASAGVSINGAVKAESAAALTPITATIDLGTDTSAEHYREIFTKAVTSDGQGLELGTDSNHDVSLKHDDLVRFVLSAAGLIGDATNGVSIALTKPSTGVSQPHATGISAAGSSISDATQLTAVSNRVTTVSASQGVKLWDCTINQIILVWNSSGTSLSVYPPNSSVSINAGTLGASKACAANTLMILFRNSATDFDALRFSVTTA